MYVFGLQLNDHLFGKELFVGQLYVSFRGRLSNFVCVLLSLLVLRVGCGCDCINS